MSEIPASSYTQVSFILFFLKKGKKKGGGGVGEKKTPKHGAERWLAFQYPAFFWICGTNRSCTQTWEFECFPELSNINKNVHCQKYSEKKYCCFRSSPGFFFSLSWTKMRLSWLIGFYLQSKSCVCAVCQEPSLQSLSKRNLFMFFNWKESEALGTDCSSIYILTWIYIVF